MCIEIQRAELGKLVFDFILILIRANVTITKNYSYSYCVADTSNKWILIVLVVPFDCVRRANREFGIQANDK